MRTKWILWPSLVCSWLLLGAVAGAQTAAPAAPAVPTAASAGGAPQAEGLITLTVSEAKLADVLRSLAQMRPSTNIIIDPEVTGTVSFALRDVTWDMALKLIVESQGYEFTKEGGNLYRVHRPKVESKQAVTIEMLATVDVETMTDDQIAALLGPITGVAVIRTPDEARRLIMATPEAYIKRLSVESRPAAEVITEIAKKTGLSYAFSASLEGKGAEAAKPAGPGAPAVAAPAVAAALPPVSLNLKLISVENAITMVAQQGGLSCSNRNGVWMISPRPAAEVQQEPLLTETFEVRFIPVDDVLVTLCKSLLSARGSVAKGRNRILIVRDSNQGLEAVRKAIEVMDTATPQVLIEARFFELNDSSEKRLGVNWSALGDGVSITADPLTWGRSKTISTTDREEDGKTSTSTTETDLGTGVIDGTLKDVVSTVKEDLRSRTVSTTRTALLDAAEFGVVLHALMTDAGAKQLSNPKIIVNSDEQATIHIGRQTPILKSSVESTTTGPIRTYELDPDFGGETVEEVILKEEDRGAKPAAGSAAGKMRKYTTPKGYLDLGTKLTVAPSVKTPEEIYVRVVPELTSVESYLDFGSGESRVTYPVLFTTRVHTEFAIRSGQTIAIGGLVNEQTQKSESKVPVLGSIPFVGRLFRYNTDKKVQSETIIFLTVKAVNSKDLTTVSAVPIRANLVQPEVDRIANEDSEGATYNEDRARVVLKAKEAEQRKQGLAERARKAFGQGEAEPVATPSEAPAEPEAETIQATPQEAAEPGK